MFGLTGIRCGVCGMAFENKDYTKGQHGEEVYWADPKMSKLTDVRVDFCGALHSHQWHKERMEGYKDVPQEDTDQSAG